jgi:hypothetical protein
VKKDLRTNISIFQIKREMQMLAPQVILLKGGPLACSKLFQLN